MPNPFPIYEPALPNWPVQTQYRKPLCPCVRYLNLSHMTLHKYNIAFETAFLLALPDRCIQILIKSKRFPEAALFAKSYIPKYVP